MGDDRGNDDEDLQMGTYFDKWTEEETRCQTREQGEHTDAEENTWLFQLQLELWNGWRLQYL